MDDLNPDRMYAIRWRNFIKAAAVALLVLLLGNEVVLGSLPKMLKDQAQTYGVLAGCLACIVYNFAILAMALRLPWPEAHMWKRKQLIHIVLRLNVISALLMAGVYYSKFLEQVDDSFLWAELSARLRTINEMQALQALGMALIAFAWYLSISSFVPANDLVRWAYRDDEE